MFTVPAEEEARLFGPETSREILSGDTAGTKTVKYCALEPRKGLRYCMRWQGKSKRMSTGGRRIPSRGKRKYENGREAGEPVVAPTKKKVISTRGDNQKIRLLRCDMASVSDPKTGKSQKVKIESVVENEASLHYTRRNIITKGAVIKTEIGNALVTNRPGQDGVVSAILLSTESSSAGSSI